MRSGTNSNFDQALFTIIFYTIILSLEILDGTSRYNIFIQVELYGTFPTSFFSVSFKNKAERKTSLRLIKLALFGCHKSEFLSKSFHVCAGVGVCVLSFSTPPPLLDYIQIQQP